MPELVVHICVSFVISLLVSLILLGICMMGNLLDFLDSYIQSQTTRKLPLFHAELLSILISILISLILFGFGIPVIAYCADGDEQTNSPDNDGIGAPQSREAPPVGEGTENLAAESASLKKRKERIMINFFLNVWQSIMNFFIKNGKNERSPYVEEQVIHVPKEEMMKRIAEVVKKASEDD